jgi:hypothetical protein
VMPIAKCSSASLMLESSLMDARHLWPVFPGHWLRLFIFCTTIVIRRLFWGLPFGKSLEGSLGSPFGGCKDKTPKTRSPVALAVDLPFKNGVELVVA